MKPSERAKVEMERHGCDSKRGRRAAGAAAEACQRRRHEAAWLHRDAQPRRLEDWTGGAVEAGDRASGTQQDCREQQTEQTGHLTQGDVEDSGTADRR